MSESLSPRAWYERRVAECDRRLEHARRRDLLLGRLRAATFLPALAAFVCAWAQPHLVWLWALGGVLLAAFISIVRVHEATRRAAEDARLRRAMNHGQLARMDRRWDDVPTPGAEPPAEHAAVAHDLDLFGRASLFQLAALAHTPHGRDLLRDWLTAPAAPGEIVDRQQAARMLAPQAELREEIDRLGRMLGVSRASAEALLEWAEGDDWLSAKPALKFAVRALPVAVGAVIVAALAGWLGLGALGVTLIVLLLINLAIYIAFGGRAHATLQLVTARNHSLQHYRPLFEAIGELPAEAPFFARLRSRLGATPHEALARLGRLMRVSRIADLSHDGLFGIPYAVSELFVLTDFQLLLALEAWRRHSGHAVRGWLHAVGELEAICSLAALAHDNPEWATPTVDPGGEKKVSARALGHPLLAADACVRNDVTVGPPGSFVLVTGSNMSGKSTLMRAVGVNVMLAQAGAPVCAEAMRMPPVRVATSMRVHDSLADGVSFFLAELKRLKQVVDEAHECERDAQCTLLYLLDEVLQGTNSAERRIAVSRVVGRLVEHGAVGMVSTHDLALGDTAELRNKSEAVHFRETITGEGPARRMTFDYHLRPGVATSTNALRLLEMVGLGEAPGASDEPQA